MLSKFFAFRLAKPCEVKGESTLTKHGGGGENRTRVLKFFSIGLYMLSLFFRREANHLVSLNKQT